MSLLVCVRKGESDRGGVYPFQGGYDQPYIRARGDMGTYTAYGAYQIVQATWTWSASRAGVDLDMFPTVASTMRPGAEHPEIQDLVAVWLVDNNWAASAWFGHTECGLPG